MDKEIIDYIIINNNEIFKLERSVKDFIKKGYIPQGGVCVNELAFRDTSYYQAMVKFKED